MKFKKLLNITLGISAITLGATTIPVASEELQFIEAYQFNVSQQPQSYEEMIAEAPVSLVTDVGLVLMEEQRKINASFTDENNDDIISVAVFRKKNGELKYIQMEEVDYDKITKKGGASFNPKAKENLNVIDLLIPNKVEGALTQDGVSETSWWSLVSSRTQAHTVTSNTNGLLSVGLATGYSVSYVSGVTYNGDALTQRGYVQATSSGTTEVAGYGISFWTLFTPDTGTNNVVVSFSPNSYGIWGAVSHTDVNQSTTFDTGYSQIDGYGSGSCTTESVDIITSSANRGILALQIGSDNGWSSNGTGVTNITSDTSYNRIRLNRRTTFPETTSDTFNLTINASLAGYCGSFAIAFEEVGAGGGAYVDPPKLIWFD